MNTLDLLLNLNDKKQLPAKSEMRFIQRLDRDRWYTFKELQDLSSYTYRGLQRILFLTTGKRLIVKRQLEYCTNTDPRVVYKVNKNFPELGDSFDVHLTSSVSHPHA